MNDDYRDVLRTIESTSPTPGGGAVAALILGHGIALNRMVCGLTLGREKWIDGHKIANDFLNLSESWIDASIIKANVDCEAFEKVMLAYKFPKDTEEEKNQRKLAINEANKLAIESPLDIAHFCLKVMNEMPDIAKTCNSNAITDLGTANNLILAATESAALNVRINFSSSEDNYDYELKIEKITNETRNLHSIINRIVNDRM
tara:strand:- start:110490 stop:111098 length:609 start_codon:yes stop_codon:yes gene_type:complete